MTEQTPKQVYDAAVRSGKVRLEDVTKLLQHSLELHRRNIRGLMRSIDPDYANSGRFRKWVRSLDLESVSDVHGVVCELVKGRDDPKRLLEIIMYCSVGMDVILPNHAEHIKTGLRNMLLQIMIRCWGQVHGGKESDDAP